MKLYINKLTSQTDLIKRLGHFLHDSVLERERDIDSANKVYTLSLERIYYEKGDQMIFFYFPIWKFTTIKSLLKFGNIELIEDNRKIPLDDGEPEILLDITLTNSENKILVISSSFGATNLEISEQSYIEIEDIGNHTDKWNHRSFFSPMIDKDIINEFSTMSLDENTGTTDG